MYSREQLKRGLENPKEIFRELNRLYHTRLRTRDHNESGIDVFDRDWDSLIILDACRYDAFQSVVPNYDLPGETSRVVSRSAATTEFVRSQMGGRDLTDTVYVTGTTMLYRDGPLSNEVDLNLHDVVDVWKTGMDEGTIAPDPERMADRAIETAETYPNKRLVVHFIQPHTPFIGERGCEVFAERDVPVWHSKFDGSLDVSDDVLWECYIENLQTVLPHAKRLLVELEGLSVITADHGQYIGERGFPIPIKEYGHPEGTYAAELVDVPWHEFQNGSRRRIVAEPPASEYSERRSEEMDETARQHLRELGYVDV